jgi:hypothetical protein
LAGSQPEVCQADKGWILAKYDVVESETAVAMGDVPEQPFNRVKVYWTGTQWSKDRRKAKLFKKESDACVKANELVRMKA